MAVQQGWQLYWVHEDSITKSQRTTDVYGNVVSTVELDPWGANTNRSSNSAFQPQNFGSYIRDGNGGQDAMARRYTPTGRFSQPDPYGRSYDFEILSVSNNRASPEASTNAAHGRYCGPER